MSIDLRYKPKWLPQVSAPYEYVVTELGKEGIEHEKVDIHPSELKPLQGIISYEKIDSFGDKINDPIWISINNEVLDGHHRYGKSIVSQNKPLKAIKIKLNYKDAARILNKIQDIYDYEHNENLEEVVAQDILNIKNDPNIEKGQQLLSDTKGKKLKLEAYRKSKIIENSATGNFFSTQPRDGYKKYMIEFDNLLDVADLGINDFNKGELPTYKVLKIIFPNLNVEYPNDKQAEINKAVAKVLKKLGYDGIKYGDIMIQSF